MLNLKHLTALTACAAAALSAWCATTPHHIYDLGATPWKFSRVVHNDSADVVIPIDTGEHVVKTSAPRSITLVFPGDAVRYTQADVEASTDGTHWHRLTKAGDQITCQINRTNGLSQVGTTFGYVSTIESTSLATPLQPIDAFVRFRVKACFDDHRQPVQLPTHSRATVQLAAGYEPDSVYASSTLPDGNWATVGIPHCFNETDTYLNATSGERCWRGEVWYRKKLNVSSKNKGKKYFLEFHSANIGTTVWVNSHPIGGCSAVAQPGPVTHVGSALPFVVDITPYLIWGQDNQLAIHVSNAKGSFYTYPAFAENEGFGQAMGGITSKLLLHTTSPVHIPLNAYQPLEQWGTYYGTLSADEHKAVVRLLTRVQNETPRPQRVELITTLTDDEGHTALRFSDRKIIGSNAAAVFDRTDSIINPRLWYPVGGPGKPHLYTVNCQVRVDGTTVDVHNERIGLRTVTWDKDYCYVNGHKILLRGFGNRNIYPGLGAAVPVALQRQEVARIANCGGNVLRIGHQPPYLEAFDAADEMGVMLIVNSGDNEWALHNEPANTYKSEYDRDAIIAFRNHPSVVVWESNNGLAYDGVRYLPSRTLEQVLKWDFINPRIVSNRDGYPPEWDSAHNVLISYTNRYDKDPNHPSLNAEVYGTNWSGNPSWCIARFDYHNEKRFAQFYVQDYLDNIGRKACGWINWMLAETYGEGYTIYLNGRRNQKSLGSCAMDGNRFPKLSYRVLAQALWVPYSQRPGVALQSAWLQSEGPVQTIEAWSNCPKVSLSINGTDMGTVVPDSLTRRCVWPNVNWKPGTVVATGLDASGLPVCADSISSAGEPHAIVVTIEPQGPDMVLSANGSDAFIVTARVVDAQGRWCPEADCQLHFGVEGPGAYKGSYNFYIAEGHDITYHAPGDPELQAEGGLMRVAVRTTFTPGPITVTVSSPGLVSGSATVQSQPINIPSNY